MHQLAQKLTTTAFSPRKESRLTTSPDGVDEHEVGCGVSDVGADLVVTLAEVGVVGGAEHDHGAVFGQDFRTAGEGVVEGYDDGRYCGQAKGEDYPLLELGESL